MTGKASLPKTPIDDTVRADKERKKQFGRERANFSKVSLSDTTGMGYNFATNKSKSGGALGEFLPLAGGRPMIGPIAFNAQSLQISNGIIDVGASGFGFSSRIVITGDSIPDDLVTITGANNDGQILFLQVVNGHTVVLKQHTGTSTGGNINIPGGSDFTVSSQDIVLLQWDSFNDAHSTYGGQWTLVSSSSSSSSGATRELDNLQNTAVNADIIPATASSVDLGSLTKPYDRTYSDEVVFVTEGAISTNKPTIGWGNSTRGMTFSMHSLGSTQTAWTWAEGGSAKMSLSNSGMLNVGTVVSTTLLRAEGDTELGNGTSDDLTITARVDSDIIPKTTQSYDLGDADRWWDKVYSMYIYTNRISLSGVSAQIDMNNNPIVECGDIDFDGSEHIRRSGVNFIEFQSTKILIEKPVQIEEDLTMAAAYFNPGNVTASAASGTANFFYVKVPDSGASGWAYAKVPCYT